MSSVARNALLAGALALAFVAGREGVRLFNGPSSGESASPTESVANTAGAAPGGATLRMIFIASGSCGACGDPRMPGLVRGAAENLRRQSAVAGLRFSTLGVGVDPSVRVGLENLGRFGEFEQVVVGGRWENLGTLAYVWEKHSGRAAVPQILVMYEVIEAVPTRILGAKDAVIARLVGLDQIQAWAARGYRITIPEDSVLVQRLK